MTVIWHAEIDDKEIVLSQNGRFLEFTKRNSPIIYKYDLVTHYFDCYTRATGEVRNRHPGEMNRWFKAKLTTEDDKLAAMFVYAHALAGHNRDAIMAIMDQFSNRKMENFEQWAALGTKFTIGNYGWGNGNNIPQGINHKPNEFEDGVRSFIISKTWKIGELNNFAERVKDAEVENIDQIFKEIAESPEYLSDFIIINHGETTNYLTESRLALVRFGEIIEKYNLEIKRLLIYIHYLNNVEYVNIETILQEYPSYLEKELARNNGRRNRMYKYPRYFMSTIHTQIEKERRDTELENYNPDDQEYNNAYLEYRDDDYFIMIPRSPEDVREEGRQQGHCVATRFMDYIAAGDTSVVFMRRTDDPNTSLITIEVRNNRMRQACIGDNQEVPGRYREWIRNWAEIKGIDIDNRSWSTMLDVDI